MDNFDLINFDEKRFDEKNKQENSKEDDPIPFDLDDSPEPESVKQTAPPPPKPAKIAKKAIQSEADRITGVKTFFTKLHIGAITYLDEQISEWLGQNPGISIKKTNVVCGDVISKTTENNLIITIWY
jgi:hypothetical protein